MKRKFNRRIQLFIIGVLIALGVLVIVHESGHYLAARMFGVTVDKFSIGFGPKLFGVKKGNTNFILSLVPLGGYVKMKGDEPQEGSEFKRDDFYGQSWWRRAIIVFAGPIANLFLGFILLSSSFLIGRTIEDHHTIIGSVSEQMSVYFQSDDRVVSVNDNEVGAWRELIEFTREGKENLFIVERDGQINEIVTDLISPHTWTNDILPLVSTTVGSVAPGMPAYRSGLKTGDQILKVDGDEVADWFEMRKQVVSHPEDEVELTIQREDRVFDIIIPLETNLLDDKGEKIIGITQAMPIKYIERFNITDSIKYGFYSTASFIILNYQALFKVLTRPFIAKDHIGGPVMIIEMSRHTSQMGLGAIIAFIASVSLILMIMNLLPIPVLDGGHILFCFVEGIFKRQLPYKTQLIVQQIGFMILILLMLFAFFNDFSRMARRGISLRNLDQIEIIE